MNATRVDATKHHSRGRAMEGLAVLPDLSERNFEVLDSNFWIFCKFDYFDFYVIVGSIYFEGKHDSNIQLELSQIMRNMKIRYLSLAAILMIG